MSKILAFRTVRFSSGKYGESAVAKLIITFSRSRFGKHTYALLYLHLKNGAESEFYINSKAFFLIFVNADKICIHFRFQV